LRLNGLTNSVSGLCVRFRDTLPKIDRRERTARALGIAFASGGNVPFYLMPTPGQYTAIREQTQGSGPAEWASKRSEYSRLRKQYWDEYASGQRFERVRRYYRQCLARRYRFMIPPGMRVLELGCANGDLLAALEPSYGVGIDFSPVQIHQAATKYPRLVFHLADAHDFDLHEQFDCIVLSDLANELWDVQQVLERVARHSHAGTRIIVNSYSRVWDVPRRMAEAIGLVRSQLPQNWLTGSDILNLLLLADFAIITKSCEILWPVRTPGLDVLCNRYLARLPVFRHLGITNFIVARPRRKPISSGEAVVSVVVPARNEAGHIAQLLDRIPQMGAGTEIIFVEGNSSDDTWAVIEKEMARFPGCRVKLLKQPGRGKGDAVRLGFANASGDLLMILDADLSVAPEDLPRFYDAWISGRGEFINGVRLVYPMEQKAMRSLNFLANKFFSLAFTWLLSQGLKDTLCGVKVLGKKQYETICANRSYFGDFDPFGDFDLLFGAAKQNLQIVDLPIRYQERTYGATNINRWRDGWLLLRMLWFALWRIKFV
jgi:SAM-dependent methyltransferase